MVNPYSQLEILPVYPSIHPRTLLPLQLPPQELVPHYPPLPTPFRQPSFAESFKLTRHVVQGAYPRSHPYIPLSSPLPNNLNGIERREHAKQQLSELMKAKESHENGQLSHLPVNNKVHWMVVNRYVRKTQHSGHTAVRGGVTLFFAQATGFPKETWEPVISHLLKTPAGVLVDEIWAPDAVQHGDSALLNMNVLSAAHSASDDARDVLNLLLYYIPSEIIPGDLPTNLKRFPEGVAESRRKDGFLARKLISVGHSFGGSITLLFPFRFIIWHSSAIIFFVLRSLAALTVPALFDTLILIDPQIQKPFSFLGGISHLESFTLNVLLRRDTWKSREEAFRLLSQTPFFRAWDPEVLKLYVETATYDLPSGGIALKQPGLLEALIYTEVRVTYEIWERLSELDERIELCWVFPGIQQFGEKGEKAAQVLAWRRPTRCSNVRIEGAGHLIVQEKPCALAHYIGGLINRKAGRSRL